MKELLNNSYGNLREVIGEVGVGEKFFRRRPDEKVQKETQELLEFALTSRLHLTRNPITAGDKSSSLGRGGTSQWNTPGVYYADLTLGGRVITVKLLRKHDSGTHARCSTPPTSRSAGRRPFGWEIEDLKGTSRPWDWRTPRSGGGEA